MSSLASSLLRLSLWGLIEVGVFLGLLATALPWLGGVSWAADLFSPFRVQVFFGLLVLGLLLFFGKRRAWSVAALVGIVVNGLCIGPAYWDRSRVAEERESGAELRLLVANVLTRNLKREETVAWCRDSEADVLALMETNDDWIEAFEALAETHPHSSAMPQSNNFGMLLRSRYPIKDPRFEELSESGVPALFATILHPEAGELPLILAHPIPPMGGQNWEDRNTYLRALAEKSPVTEKLILAGDFNLPPWSPNFSLVTRNGELHDSRRGFGNQATWPKHMRILQTPIDHVFFGGGWKVRSRETGPWLGSDHRGIILDLLLTEGP